MNTAYCHFQKGGREDVGAGRREALGMRLDHCFYFINALKQTLKHSQ